MWAGSGGAMNSETYIADMAVRIAQAVFPTLKIMGQTKDRQGIDAMLQGLTVQIKGDQTIAKTGNLYHEYYEKTKHNPEQPWRRSPAPVDHFIFVTEYLLVSLPIQVMAELEIGLPLRQINPTSIGTLIPLSRVGAQYQSRHVLWRPWPTPDVSPPFNMAELSFDELDGTNGKPGRVLG